MTDSKKEYVAYLKKDPDKEMLTSGPLLPIARYALRVAGCKTKLTKELDDHFQLWVKPDFFGAEPNREWIKIGRFAGKQKKEAWEKIACEVMYGSFHFPTSPVRIEPADRYFEEKRAAREGKEACNDQ